MLTLARNDYSDPYGVEWASGPDPFYTYNLATPGPLMTSALA